MEPTPAVTAYSDRARFRAVMLSGWLSFGQSQPRSDARQRPQNSISGPILLRMRLTRTPVQRSSPFRLLLNFQQAPPVADCVFQIPDREITVRRPSLAEGLLHFGLGAPGHKRPYPLRRLARNRSSSVHATPRRTINPTASKTPVERHRGGSVLVWSWTVTFACRSSSRSSCRRRP